MRIAFALPFVALVAISTAAVAAPADQQSNSSRPLAVVNVDDAALEERVTQAVRKLLKSSPELVIEAITDYQQRKQADEQNAAMQRLSMLKPLIYEDPAAPVGGNPNGDITVVEFFDYQCGYCKSVQPDLTRLLADDGRVRIIYKEFPILGPASLTASKAALASRAQGKYEAFHAALMEHRGQLDDAVINRLAQSVGLDVDQLRRDMESPEVMKAISANATLAEQLNIRGTPGFIIADQILPGAIKLDEMKQLVRRARAL